ncbi:protein DETOXIFICATION 16-like [Nicotiana tabacum]|uniref:Protein DETOXIFICATION 16-like n=1 Tax=Nicotiana tabacum TaxID=4097 RepID=A0AC58STX7_TOBAC
MDSGGFVVGGGRERLRFRESLRAFERREELEEALLKEWGRISSKSLVRASTSSTVDKLSIFEYWSFEMVVLLSGLLPNPKLETSVLSISLNTCWMVYMVSVGLGAAIREDLNLFFSTRVSNELGAGRPQGARLALYVIVVVAISVGLIIATTTILVRFVWGKLYSNEEEVIAYVAKILPLLALSDFLDGFQCVLSGAARGCGWQKLCAFINLGAYYVVGLPSSVLFAFVFQTGGMGLWMGIICALLVQNVALIAINICTNWDKEASKAVNRVQLHQCGGQNVYLGNAYNEEAGESVEQQYKRNSSSNR